MTIDWNPRDLGNRTSYVGKSDEGSWRIAYSGGRWELRFGRSENQGIAVAMEIAAFSSPAEAMVAAEIYCETSLPETVDAAVSHAMAPYYPGAHKLDVHRGPHHEGYFYVATNAGGGTEQHLEYESMDGEHEAFVARLWATTMPEDNQPAPAARLKQVEDAIVLQLLDFRLARGTGRYHEPMTRGEFEEWRVARANAAPQEAGPGPRR